MIITQTVHLSNHHIEQGDNRQITIGYHPI